MDNSKKSWTLKEEKFVKQNIDNMTHKEIGKILGRSRSAISHKVKRLGLSKSSVDLYLKALSNISMTKKDKIYLAGFYDGEGSFFISLSIRDNGYIRMEPHVSINNSSLDSMNYISGIFNKNLVKRSPWNSKNKELYQIVLGMYDSMVLCQNIYQYSIVKKDIIKLYMEFVRRRITDTSYDSKDVEIFIEIKKLNLGISAFKEWCKGNADFKKLCEKFQVSFSSLKT